MSVAVQVEIEEDAVTVQENGDVAPNEGGVAPKTDGVAPNVAPKESEIAPKDDASCEDAVKDAVKTLGHEDSVAEKCAALYAFLKEDSQRTITTAAERLAWSRRSVISYVGILKEAKALDHVGPYRGGTWKFLI